MRGVRRVLTTDDRGRSMRRKRVTAVIANLTRMRAVTELRATLDAFAARCAAIRVAGGADCGALLDAFADLQRATRSGRHELIADADLALHLAIVELADVEGLREAWMAAASVQSAFRIESIRTCWPDLNVLFEAHRPIVDSVCDGNAVLAEDSARAHLDAVWYRLAEQTGDASLADDPLARATTYMEFHLSEPMRLSLLARYFAKTTPGHLSRLFRQRYGHGFRQHLRSLRLRKASEMLVRTALPIGRIASITGYRDPSRFAADFRRQFNKSPRDFRHTEAW